MTGAGDALVAGVLAALLDDAPLDDALQMGVDAATQHIAGSLQHDTPRAKL